MDSSKIDSNIKQILDLRNNKGVFPLSTESAIIAHSPGGEMTYLDSVIDYLYQQVANKLRLYTEQDGNNTRGKAYPATMGLIDAANIASLQSNMDRYVVLLNALQQQVDNMDPTDDIASMNSIINQLQQDFNNLMQASEYTYQEIKFSDSAMLPSSNLDNSDYWDERPQLDFNHLWLGVRTITVKRGSNGEAIITRGNPTIVSLQGPRGEQGPPGPRGGDGQPGESYRPVLMYKWTDSRIVVPDTPTDPLNQGWSENPGSSVGNAKYLWMTQNYKKMSTNTYLNSWSTPVCLSGEDGNSPSQGLSGPVMRFRGEYTPNTEYINSSLNTTLSLTDIRYMDVVMLGANYYMVKPLANATRTTTISPLQTGQTDWQEAIGFSFIAAEALYARNAHIDNLSGYEFVVQDNAQNNYIVAGMTGGNVVNSVVGDNDNNNPVRIWAGSRATDDINLQDDNIPFKVFQNGKLKATNAEIKGDLSIDSLLLSGNQGSYYYNESSITLPRVESNKHRVIFIITAENGTTVHTQTGDVLFAFSNNNMQTTNSTTLSTYKIYLAISVNNGQNSGWLLQNLNALELNASLGYYAHNILQNLQGWPKTIYSEEHNDQILLYLRRDMGNIYNFTTVNTSSYPSASSPEFTLGGYITFEITSEEENEKTIATLNLLPIELSGITESNQQQYLTVGDIIDNYNYNQSKLQLSGTEGTISIYSNSNNHSQDYILISIPKRLYIDAATPISVTPSLVLTESFTYPITTNQTSPVTTTTVGSNGLIIKDGVIVATDMQEGASVNMKDCIAYKDITETATNEHYEVINFGASNITIGNTILSPNNPIIIKAQPNIHIDFSDVAAIDASDIYDTDPVEHGDPVNH